MNINVSSMNVSSKTQHILGFTSAPTTFPSLHLHLWHLFTTSLFFMILSLRCDWIMVDNKEITPKFKTKTTQYKGSPSLESIFPSKNPNHSILTTDGPYLDFPRWIHSLPGFHAEFSKVTQGVTSLSPKRPTWAKDHQEFRSVPKMEGFLNLIFTAILGWVFLPIQLI